ncbi:hypothetical protein DVK85_10665 [Flavobacterium arcticum]|uniref:Lipoprotein n=1 Tax=Flavobacterium arcticum TaxID=1784713 RepID=A0A345HDK6_9FLAO|nr:hypothetical protein [Flavobacterium arcticum]AXG74666.1 hypothetical protein DVK85_10665 [Flavobacterium arcticum]KAF2512208.1 hypothetical protein E0W72_03000 [Flavobacterium arcticum]
MNIPKPSLIFIFLTSLSSLFGCSGKSNSKKEEGKSAEASLKEDNSYNEMRNGALTVKPEQLGIDIPEDSIVVYGIVMDWGIDDNTIATIVSFKNGDASLYLSSGGGIIGGGQHTNVNFAAKKFVELAENYIVEQKPAIKMPLPVKDYIIFYILTNKGIFMLHEEMRNFENSSSLLLPLFEEGNIVLSELRSISDK